VASCCYPEEYGDCVFSTRHADRVLRSFRKKGLRGSERVMADAVAEAGIAGATVLEVGGGIGALQADLLTRGAARTINVDLSPAWERHAERLFAELGTADRCVRRVGDFVVEAPTLPVADVVILNRVVCCYPDWQALLDAAASRSRRVVAFAFPRPVVRGVVSAGNLAYRLRGRRFRMFVHPAGSMLAFLRDRGLSIRTDRSGPVWRTVVLERP
jgi:magnesium-protoporphyrin O-methyltransferase